MQKNYKRKGKRKEVFGSKTLHKNASSEKKTKANEKQTRESNQERIHETSRTYNGLPRKDFTASYKISPSYDNLMYQFNALSTCHQHRTMINQKGTKGLWVTDVWDPHCHFPQLK